MRYSHLPPFWFALLVFGLMPVTTQAVESPDLQGYWLGSCSAPQDAKITIKIKAKNPTTKWVAATICGDDKTCLPWHFGQMRYDVTDRTWHIQQAGKPHNRGYYIVGALRAFPHNEAPEYVSTKGVFSVGTKSATHDISLYCPTLRPLPNPK